MDPLVLIDTGVVDSERSSDQEDDRGEDKKADQRFHVVAHARSESQAAAQSQCAGRGDSLRNQVDESPIFIVGHGQHDAPRMVSAFISHAARSSATDDADQFGVFLLTRTVISMLLILDRLSRLVQFDGQQSVAMPVFVDGARSIRLAILAVFPAFFEVGNRHGLRLCFNTSEAWIFSNFTIDPAPNNLLDRVMPSPACGFIGIPLRLPGEDGSSIST